MRVAIHADQPFFRAPGGIATYLRHLVPAMAAREPALKIALFHARFPASEAPERWMRDRWVEELPWPIRTLYPRWNLLGRPALPASLRDADLVHATNPAAIPPVAEGQRLVVTVHDLAFLRFPRMFPPAWRLLYRLGLRAAVRRAHAILTPSRNTAEDLLGRTPVDPQRLHVTPLAAALPAGSLDPQPVLSRLQIPSPYVLFVGTLEPRKNLVRLVRAYRRVAGAGHPHALVLAGPMGWHTEALRRELALEGPGQVILTGSLGPDDLDATYRGADAFVYPSLYEGFGLPVLEAMARAVPAVVSATSAVPEVAGDAAIGVDPGSVDDLARAITTILSEPDVASDLSVRGRARSERFSWDETARLTLEVFGRVTGAK